MPPLGDLGLFLFMPFFLLMFPGQLFMILLLNRGVRKIGRSKITLRGQWRVFWAAFRCVPQPLRAFSLVYFYVYLPIAWFWELLSGARGEGQFEMVPAFALILGAFYLVHFLFFAFWLPNAPRISSVLTE